MPKFLVSEHDIALTILEECIGIRADPSKDAEEALAAAELLQPDLVAGFRKAAKKVMILIASGGRPRGRG